MRKFRIEKYKIETNKKVNKRICLISDIHHDKYSKIKFYDLILKEIKSLKPDFIVIAGDIVDYGKVIENAKTLKTIEYFISELGNISKTIVTVGNHDLMYDYHKKNKNQEHLKWFNTLVKYKNIYYIFNENVVFNNIEIIHYTPTSEWFRNRKKDAFYNEFRRYPIIINKNDNYKILISHSPVSITIKHNYEKLPEITDNINLILSGHMHNGALPDFLEFIDFKKTGRGIISPSKSIFPKYCRGQHRIKDIDIIISRGITKFSKEKILRIVGIMYKSEITLIDLL